MSTSDAATGWLSEAGVAALSRHPLLPASVSRLVERLTEGYVGNRLLNQVLCDRGRALLGLLVAYLDVRSAPPAGPGATLGAVQAACRSVSLCSPGRAAAMLAAMRFAGYVSSEQGEGRRRRLVPTEKLMAEHRRRWRLQCEAMLPIVPGAARTLRHLDDRPFCDALLCEMAQRYLAGYRVLDYAPELRGIAESNAGLLIVAGLMVPSAEGPVVVPVSISALSRRFAVARSHVRKVLELAEQAGLVVRTEDGAGVVALPALRDAVLRFFAVLLLLMARCGDVAWNACRADAGSPTCDGEPAHRVTAEG